MENKTILKEKQYRDNDTGAIESYSEIEEYYNENPEINNGFDSVDDLIEQFYTGVK